MLAKQRLIRGLWGLVCVPTVESAFILRQQRAWQGSWEGDRGVNLSQGQVGDQQGIQSGAGKGSGTDLCRGGWEQPRRIQTQFQEARGRRGCYQPGLFHLVISA